MKELVLVDNDTASGPKYLWFLMLAYTLVIVFANWFNPRLITVFGLNSGSGSLIFPFSFILSDLITEVYGYKQARRAIWCGFFFNLVFLLYAQIIICMPSPEFAVNNEDFDTLLGVSSRIVVASCISYLLGEPINSYLLAKMKIKLQGRYMGLRFVSSTFFAAGVDSIIFPILAFYGTVTNTTLFELIVTVWIIKVVIEVLILPIAIRMAKRLKTIEHLDIYDSDTEFNVLSFNDNYSDKNNQFFSGKKV